MEAQMLAMSKIIGNEIQKGMCEIAKQMGQTKDTNNKTEEKTNEPNQRTKEQTRNTSKENTNEERDPLSITNDIENMNTTPQSIQNASSNMSSRHTMSTNQLPAPIPQKSQSLNLKLTPSQQSYDSKYMDIIEKLEIRIVTLEKSVEELKTKSINKINAQPPKTNQQQKQQENIETKIS